MAVTGRKRPVPGAWRGSGGAGIFGRLSFFCFFSAALLAVFTLSTLYMHTSSLGQLPSSLSPDLSYKEMTVLLRKVKGLQQRSERLSRSLNSWRSTGYEAQAFEDILPPSSEEDASITRDDGLLLPQQPSEEEESPPSTNKVEARPQQPQQQSTNLESKRRSAAQGGGKKVVKEEEEKKQQPLVRPEAAAGGGGGGRLRKPNPVKPLLLIVGGTDGSGTRSVVDLLQSLGVRMNVEDEGTMDVHGWEMQGGWPPIVKSVLRHTHSADYEVTQLPAQLQENVRGELQKFLTAKEQEAVGLPVPGVGRRRNPGATGAAGVRWGFKAPVSMLLIPFFHHMTHGVKFLHVVRDGRDIAFSGNQSPVDKFYESNYPRNEEGAAAYGSPQLKAIRLWSDWNVDIAEWSARHQDGVTFDYLQIRTEDLVDNETKYDVYKKVARFVGAGQSDEELCCMMRAPTKWMGSHDANAEMTHVHKSASNKVKSRYGSWKDKVSQHPGLQEQLERVGGRGLSRFGYHPRDNDIEFPESMCPAMPTNCHNGRLRAAVPVPRADNGGTGGQCAYAGNVDFRGPGIDLYVDNADSAEGCCRLCTLAPECQAFTYSPDDGLCYLKASEGKASPNPALLSGTVVSRSQ